MFRFMSLVLFIVLSLINEVSSDWCYDSDYRMYYCSSGQSCGSYYGDCRGLPTYVIVSIISSSILLLMICIRCCIQLNSDNTQSIPRRIPQSAQNQGYSPTNTSIHNIREDAPPSYAIATNSTTEFPKY